jgi:predicted  nucleic acid-binding Zn-ribbon protein
LQEKLQQLATLQKVDVEIAAFKKSAETYPKQIAELEKEFGLVRSAVEAERAKLDDIDRQRSTLEMTITEEKDKVKKWEARLTEQRSTREYSALAREIDIAKKSNLSMGEELTELGKNQVSQREAVKARDGELQARQKELAGKMTGLRAKLAEAEAGVKGLEEKRSEAAKGVDVTLLRRYDHIRKKRMPVLVPLATGGTCTGCRMNVPPQMYNTLSTTQTFDNCPSCQRIIYVPDAADVVAK